MDQRQGDPRWRMADPDTLKRLMSVLIVSIPITASECSPLHLRYRIPWSISIDIQLVH
jgi:hypothetical protein